MQLASRGLTSDSMPSCMHCKPNSEAERDLARLNGLFVSITLSFHTRAQCTPQFRCAPASGQIEGGHGVGTSRAVRIFKTYGAGKS